MCNENSHSTPRYFSSHRWSLPFNWLSNRRTFDLNGRAAFHKLYRDEASDIVLVKLCYGQAQISSELTALLL